MNTMTTHIVHDVSPALHGDALEDGQHGQAEVVEVGDAPVGPLPPHVAEGAVVALEAFATWASVFHKQLCTAHKQPSLSFRQ